MTIIYFSSTEEHIDKIYQLQDSNFFVNSNPNNFIDGIREAHIFVGINANKLHIGYALGANIKHIYLIQDNHDIQEEGVEYFNKWKVLLEFLQLHLYDVSNMISLKRSNLSEVSLRRSNLSEVSLRSSSSEEEIPHFFPNDDGEYSNLPDPLITTTKYITKKTNSNSSLETVDFKIDDLQSHPNEKTPLSISFTSRNDSWWWEGCKNIFSLKNCK